MVSEVRSFNGVPTLFINGKATASCAYITYHCKKAAYKEFAAAGYTMFSVPLYFTGYSASVCCDLPPEREGVFDRVYDGDEPDYTKADFTYTDKLINDILAACPKAMIFPRMNTTVPITWDQKHPEELLDKPYRDDGLCRACFASDLWMEETVKLTRIFMRHLENAPYAEHIFGYQIANGASGEWYGFDYVGSVGPRSREAFEAYRTRAGVPDDKPHFYKFLAKTAARRICELARVAKEEVGEKKVIGSFYGYVLENMERESNQHALKDVLACKDIDFLCSPVSYLDHRPVGEDHPVHVPIDTLKLHGKLYFCEQDTRTSLVTPVNDDPVFTWPVWQPPTKEHTLEIMKMHGSRSLTHGHGFWWFDMWGGWFNDPDYLTTANILREIMEDALRLPCRSGAKAAVFVDEECVFPLETESHKAHAAIYHYRRVLGLSATPYDMYLSDDFDAVCEKYNAVVFLQPHETPVTSAAIETAKKRGIPYLTVTPENCYMEPEELLTFFDEHNAGTMASEPCVAYRNQSYAFLHTAKDGVVDFRLPGEQADLFTSEKITFPAFLPGGHSYLFRVDAE